MVQAATWLGTEIKFLDSKRGKYCNNFTMMFFFVNTSFLGSRIASIFSYDPSKDK